MREKHQSVASCTPPSGDLAHNLGTCPDQESNQPPSGLQDDTQPTEPHQSGPPMCFLNTEGKGLLLLVGHRAQEYRRIPMRQEIGQEKRALVWDKDTFLHQSLSPKTPKLEESLRSTTGFCLPSLRSSP